MCVCGEFFHRVFFVFVFVRNARNKQRTETRDKVCVDVFYANVMRQSPMNSPLFFFFFLKGKEGISYFRFNRQVFFSLRRAVLLALSLS
jgi:hypothetical protein